MQKRPELKEYSDLRLTEIVHLYHAGEKRLDKSVLDLTDAQLNTEFPRGSEYGAWSCNTLLGHLADAEMAFTHRMRRVVGEERPHFSLWDEVAFLEAGLYKNMRAQESYSLIYATRKWTSSWLDTLPENAFERIGLHPERKEQSLKDIIAYATWHLELHARYLDRKILNLTNAIE